MSRPTITQLGRALRAREVSSRELVTAALARIEALDGSLNSFITVEPALALAAADRADQQLARGEGGPLTGIPFAHKDIFCTAGVRTTCASKMLADFIPPYDATVVSRLAAAGVVMLGKTNMDEFAMGSSNETSFFGPVRNPWDLQRSPGGSSGGSAAAVAAGLVPAATGTDTGGSIRQPAALCGITGLKPTTAACPATAWWLRLEPRPGRCADADQRRGCGAAAGSHGRLRSARLDLLPICRCPTMWRSWARRSPASASACPKNFLMKAWTPASAAAVREALRVYERLGAKLVEISLPSLALSVPTYYVVAPAECSSNLSRFDGVRFGHRCEGAQSLEELYKKSRGEGFGAEVKRRIMTGTYVLSAGYYDAYYLKAQKARQLIAEDFRRAFAEVDIIAGPTAPTPAFRLGEKVDDPVTDVPERHLHDRGQPGRPAGHVDALRLLRRPAGRPAADRPALRRRIACCSISPVYQRTDWHQERPQDATSGGSTRNRA
jgi:aspartyl-tRNA(Asn)/glutamyl-tRNA(Gln) amidotransferase subunit A